MLRATATKPVRKVIQLPLYSPDSTQVSTSFMISHFNLAKAAYYAVEVEPGNPLDDHSSPSSAGSSTESLIEQGRASEFCTGPASLPKDQRPEDRPDAHQRFIEAERCTRQCKPNNQFTYLHTFIRAPCNARPDTWQCVDRADRV